MGITNFMKMEIRVITLKMNRMVGWFFLDRTVWQVLSCRVLYVALASVCVLAVCGVPTITRQPPETVVDEIGVVSSTSVEAEGEGPLRYQWYTYIGPGPQQPDPILSKHF